MNGSSLIGSTPYVQTNTSYKAISSILTSRENIWYTQQIYSGVWSSVSHTVAKQTQYTPPGFSFQNLYGCTINISALVIRSHWLKVVRRRSTNSLQRLWNLTSNLKDKEHALRGVKVWTNTKIKFYAIFLESKKKNMGVRCDKQFKTDHTHRHAQSYAHTVHMRTYIPCMSTIMEGVAICRKIRHA